MKKIFLLVALFSVGNAFAQKPFKPGIKAGYTASTITGYGADYRNNFYLGAYGLLKLSKVYNMQFELMYIRQGADNLRTYTYRYNGNTLANRAVNVPLDYLSLNFINKFNFDKFNLHIGPGLDVKMSEEKIPTYAEGSGVYYENNIYTINSDIDLTFNVGLGYNITDNLGVEARMRQGLIAPIYANSNNYSSGSSHLNRSFSFGLTYTFK